MEGCIAFCFTAAPHPHTSSFPVCQQHEMLQGVGKLLVTRTWFSPQSSKMQVIFSGSTPKSHKAHQNRCNLLWLKEDRVQ